MSTSVKQSVKRRVTLGQVLLMLAFGAWPMYLRYLLLPDEMSLMGEVAAFLLWLGVAAGIVWAMQVERRGQG